MKRIYTYIIHTCLVIATLAGCRPHYPEIEYNGDPSKVEFENIETPVAIKVAISDPLYENYTRGIGAFEQVKDGATGDDSWKSADIYVYAFYSYNGLKSSPNELNYVERMNSTNEDDYFCLVDDTDDENIGHGKRARISRDRDSFLPWIHDDNKVYYSRKYPQYRYKFFAYHIDDAADMTKEPNRNKDHVSYDICIDGTQDLMCACADTTAAQIARLTSIGNKHIVNNIKALAYSTETGFRELHPVFDMEHQLALVKFYVKTDSALNAEGIMEMDPEAENVHVKNIIITTPYQGKFIVAADDTSRLGVSFTKETKQLYIPVKVKVGEDGAPLLDAQGRRITVTRYEEGKLMAGDANGFNPYIQPKRGEKEVGMGFLLPPSDSYDLQLEYCQVTTNEHGVQEERHYMAEYELRLNKGSFKAGQKYEVSIKVYGPRRIDLGLGDITWKNGGDIPVDGEEGDNGGF